MQSKPLFTIYCNNPLIAKQSDHYIERWPVYLFNCKTSHSVCTLVTILKNNKSKGYILRLLLYVMHLCFEKWLSANVSLPDFLKLSILAPKINLTWPPFLYTLNVTSCFFQCGNLWVLARLGDCYYRWESCLKGTVLKFLHVFVYFTC